MPRLKIQRLSELQQKPEIAADIILFSDDDWFYPIIIKDLGGVPAEIGGDAWRHRNSDRHSDRICRILLPNFRYRAHEESAAIGTGVTVFQVVVSERLKMTKKNKPPKNDEVELLQHTFKIAAAKRGLRMQRSFFDDACGRGGVIRSWKNWFRACFEWSCNASAKRDRRLINEFSTFVAEHPVADEYAEAESWLAGDHGISLSDAEELIVSAINNRRPFSFIRMGDGEGRWMFEFDADSALAAHSNKTARNVWFWNSRTFPPEEFWNELRKSYLDADLVGINPGFRIRFEASQSEHSDVHVLGYVGVILGNQYIFQKKTSPAAWRAIPNWAPTIWNDFRILSKTLFHNQERTHH